jgi:hypothetical protein
MRLRAFLVASLLIQFGCPVLLRAGEGGSGRFAFVEEEIGTIGAVERGAQPNPAFRISVQGQAEYRTNAEMRGATGRDDFVYTPKIELGYTVPLGRGFSLDLMARIDAVLYSRLSDNEFIDYGASAFLDYRRHPGSPRFYVGVEPYYYQGFDSEKLISEAVGVRTGIDHGIPFNHNRTLFFYGYEYAHFSASPSFDNRHQHRLIAGLTHQITSKIFAQAFYSYQYSDYYELDRQDSRNTASLSLIYNFTPHLSGSLLADFVDNNSGLQAFSYQSSGYGLSFAYQF